MSDFYYPPLEAATIKNLGLVKQLMQEHPAFFLGDHPYSPAMETMIKSWFSVEAQAQLLRAARAAEVEQTGTGDGPTLEEDRDGYLYTETMSLYTKLKTAQFSKDSDGDSMSYFRTATALLEKLIDYQERALGLKQLAENNKLIMHIMESVLTQEQREKFMEELKAKLDPKSFKAGE